MTNLATAERAELKHQLTDLKGDAKVVADEIRLIDTNERTALRTLKKLERELRRELRGVDKRRKSLARECAGDRKHALRRAGKIATRLAIVKGRLS